MSALRATPDDEVQRLQCALRDAAERAHLVDTRPYEWEARVRIDHELVPRLRGAVDDAVGVLDLLLERYDTPSQGSSPADSGAFDLCFEELVRPANQPPAPWQRVADVSFMARWELTRKREQLRDATLANDHISLLSECCSLRRRVIKATSGVEQVLAQVEGYPSVFEGLYRTERQRAIETRAAYLSFISGLRETEEEPVPLVRSVRLAGISLARLIGRDVYQDLWVDDRLRVRELQHRLLTWLRDPHDALDGQRLLGDILAFGELLMAVNRRPTLLQHDREVLCRVQRALGTPELDGRAIFEELGSVRGRDRELDALIKARTTLRSSLWSTTMERVLGELSQAEGA